MKIVDSSWLIVDRKDVKQRVIYRNFIISCLYILLVVSLSSCKQASREAFESPEYKGEQRIEKFSTIETEEGKKQWELEAAQAYVFEVEKKTKLEKLRVKFYKDEKQSSTLIAEEGELNTETGDMIAVGNVLFVNEEEETKLETDKLRWDNTKKKIVTDSFVRKTSPKGIVTGYGLEAEPDLSQVVIKRDVKAQVVINEKKNDGTNQ